MDCIFLKPTDIPSVTCQHQENLDSRSQEYQNEEHLAENQDNLHNREVEYVKDDLTAVMTSRNAVLEGAVS